VGCLPLLAATIDHTKRIAPLIDEAKLATLGSRQGILVYENQDDVLVNNRSNAAAPARGEAPSALPTQ
jgi:hypothetical protein